jgi:hypothetical protein
VLTLSRYRDILYIEFHDIRKTNYSKGGNKMKRENMIKKLNEDMRELREQCKKDDEEKIQNIDLCPNCSIAYCQGRYTTGQCE